MQTSEGLGDHRFGGLGIEVTDDDERHVIRHVPGVVELNQTRETRVLEVLGQTDHVTLVRRTFVDILHELFLRLGRGVVGVHIVLLKHVLQLRLESTEDRVDETIGEDRQPAIHLCSREGVVVRRKVKRRISVHTLGTDEIEHVEEIFGRRDLRLTHGALVDLGGELLTDFRIGSIAVLVVQSDDRVIDRFLFLPVEGADTLCALEEHVLQIVRQTGVLCRFVHGTCANYYIARYIRCIVVFPQKHSETVFQLVLCQTLTGLSGEKCDAAYQQQSAK